jgi:hypothetical protein
VWAFWIACGLAALGGVAPLVLAGTSSRISAVVIPFAVAAVALAACALLSNQGKPPATLLYFVASLAIVYGVLALLTVPLRLAVLGTCPPPPASCGLGLDQPLTSGESTGLGFAIGMGIIAILTGFFGLVTLYRQAIPTPSPTPPPTRRIEPVGVRTATAPAAAAVASPPATPEQAGAEQPQVAARPSEPEPELPTHEPNLELAAPAEPLELPDTGTADPVEVATPAPARKPRRRRAPKPAPDAPPAPTEGGPA